MEHTIDPVYDEHSRILILGSFPSVKSREQKFFYGHKQNRFWKVLAGILGCEVPQTIEEKKAMLLEHHIAVWDVIQSCEILIQQADAKIDFIGESPVYVWADEFKTEQVIRNYLTNAIHHVDNERRIEVRVLSKDDIVRVTVFNSGHPIPQEDLAKLWDKFYKVDKAHTREYGGNGIGLSIVKAIMESFHQKYGVRNFDNGVEFWFELDGKSALHEEQNAIK